MKRDTEKVKCVNCGIVFERNKKDYSRGGFNNNYRAKNTITCSKKCSKEYNSDRGKTKFGGILQDKFVCEIPLSEKSFKQEVLI